MSLFLVNKTRKVTGLCEAGNITPASPCGCAFFGNCQLHDNSFDVFFVSRVFC